MTDRRTADDTSRYSGRSDEFGDRDPQDFGHEEGEEEEQQGEEEPQGESPYFNEELENPASPVSDGPTSRCERNHMQITHMALLIMNKIRLGYDEDVCLKSLWHLMLLSIVNSDDGVGRVEFVTEALESLADDKPTRHASYMLELETLAGHMMKIPTQEDVERFFNNHFDAIPAERLYAVTEQMEIEWVRVVEQEGHAENMDARPKKRKKQKADDDETLLQPGQGEHSGEVGHSGQVDQEVQTGLSAAQQRVAQALQALLDEVPSSPWTPSEFMTVDVSDDEGEDPLEKELRYMNSGLDEVSDPELWNDIHNFDLQMSVKKFHMDEKDEIERLIKINENKKEVPSSSGEPHGHPLQAVQGGQDGEDDDSLYEPSIIADEDLPPGLPGHEDEDEREDAEEEIRDEARKTDNSSPEVSDDGVDVDGGLTYLLKKQKRRKEKTLKLLHERAEEAEAAGDYAAAEAWQAEADRLSFWA